MSEYRKWIDEGRHPTVASFNASKANATVTPSSTPPTTTTTVCPDTKKAENAWMGWQRCARKADRYPILEKDRDYNDWFIKVERQFEEDRCARMLDQNFSENDAKWGPDDKLLYKAQVNWMSTVLEKILQTSDGKRFNRKNKTDPNEV